MPLLLEHKWGIQFLASFQESYLISMDILNNIVIWHIDMLVNHKIFNTGLEAYTMSFAIDYSGKILIGNTEGLLYQFIPSYSQNLTHAIKKEDLLIDPSSSICSLKILPDGKLLALTSDFKFYYLDQKYGSIFNTFDYKSSSWSHNFDILSDGRIVMSGQNGQITVFTFPLRKIIPQDLYQLAVALKNNHSVNSIKLAVDQKDEKFLDQINNFNEKKEICRLFMYQNNNLHRPNVAMLLANLIM